METLTSVALARELNGILKGARVAEAEQAEGKALLIHLRMPRGGATDNSALDDNEDDSGPAHLTRGPLKKAAQAGTEAWLVLTACAGESTLFLAKKKPTSVGTTWPAPISAPLEGATIESVSHPGLERVLTFSLAPPGGRHRRGATANSKRSGAAADGGGSIAGGHPSGEHGDSGAARQASGSTARGSASGERRDLTPQVGASFESERTGARDEPAPGHMQSGSQGEGATGLLLFLELMTGRPKAVLVEDGTEAVLEAFPSRRGGSGRSFMPGEGYRRPAVPVGKLDPWDLDVPALERVLGPAVSEDDLIGKVLGIGKDLARELLARSDHSGRSAAAELKDIIASADAPRAGYVLMGAGRGSQAAKNMRAGSGEQGRPPEDRGRSPADVPGPAEPAEKEWQARRSAATLDDSAMPRALAYRPSWADASEVLSYSTVNEAARNAFEMCRQIFLERGRRRVAAKGISIELKRTARTRRALVQELEEARKAGELRLKGELILAHMKKISRGQKEVELPVPEDESRRTVCISLEARLSPAENAAIYFKRAKKLERKLASLPETIERVSRREAGLQEELDRARLGRISPARDAGKKAKSPAAGSKPGRWPTGVWPRRFASSDGWIMYVGRNNKENDYLTFVFARPDDLWFHAEGVRGSHVILRREGRRSKPSRRCIEEAASAAAYFSKARTSQTVPVIYTEKKYVRKPRKAKPGMALYSNEKSVMVSPAVPSAEAE
jgi:predicted ribosome quality control (RQC) complex YloA/Tae2 family protein